MRAFSILRLRELQDGFITSDVRDPDIYLTPRVANPLRGALNAAPLFEDLSDAGQWLVRTIHGVVDLYQDVAPGDVEFYLGRCGATPDHVYGRFDAHLEKRQHIGGIVVLRCKTSTVTKWESVAIRALNGLRNRGRLCVANVACHGGGGMPATEESAMYLTWQILPDTADIRVAVRRDVDIISERVAAQMAGRVTSTSVARAIDPITRPVRDRLELSWARGHWR